MSNAPLISILPVKMTLVTPLSSLMTSIFMLVSARERFR
jgi:hypothetical protein